MGVFDFKFDKFVTPDLIRFVYGLWVVLTTFLFSVVVIGAVIAGFRSSLDEGPLVGTGAAALSGVLYLLGLLGMRIVLETTLVFFRIEENTRGRSSTEQGGTASWTGRASSVQASEWNWPLVGTVAAGVVVVLLVVATLTLMLG